MSSKPPRGVPIPPRPRQDRRDSGVTAAVWGRDLSVRPQSPTGRPYPSAAQAGPEGLGCNRRCVGEGVLRVSSKPPRGVPIPPRPRQDRRDSGVTAAVWGRDLSVRPQSPTGRPYPSAAQAGPEGLGCNRRCVGEGALRAYSKPPRGVPIPPRPGQDRRGSGVPAAVWGRVPSDPNGPTPSPRVPCGARGKDSFPHTAAVTPESLRSCLGRGGIGTSRGGWGAHGEVPPPHSGGYTRVPPVLPGPRRDRDAPWGF